MRTRSKSTIERDLFRAEAHKARKLLQESDLIDWNSVENQDLEEWISDLEDLLIYIEDSSLCDELNVLLSDLQTRLV